MIDQTISQTARRMKVLNPEFLTVAAFSAIGILAMLNVMLRFPDLGTLIAQYSQF
jgi:hypothetical protein